MKVYLVGLMSCDDEFNTHTIQVFTSKKTAIMVMDKLNSEMEHPGYFMVEKVTKKIKR